MRQCKRDRSSDQGRIRPLVPWRQQQPWRSATGPCTCHPRAGRRGRHAPGGVVVVDRPGPDAAGLRPAGSVEARGGGSVLGVPARGTTWGRGIRTGPLFPPFLRMSDIRYREAPRLTRPGGRGGAGARSDRYSEPSPCKRREGRGRGGGGGRRARSPPRTPYGSRWNSMFVLLMFPFPRSRTFTYPRTLA
jgi:hypothetical protein